MKKLLILFSILFCLKNMQAQNTCATAINFTVAPDGPTETQTQSVKWYKFTSKSTKVRYKLRFISSTGADKPNKIILWSGTCGSLTQLEADTLSSSTDSLLEIANYTLTNNTTYYIEVKKSNSTNNVQYYSGLNFKAIDPLCSECNLPASLTCDLICNGSFENMVPGSSQPIGYTPTNGEINVCGWENATSASPDYFTTSATGTANIPNTGFGNQLAHIGSAMTGFFANNTSGWHEYIYQPLQSPLIPGRTYTISFFTKPSPNSTGFASNIGALFVDNATLSSYSGMTGGITGVTLQTSATGVINNTSGWTQVSGNFVATGLEEYIIIGNFGNTISPTPPLYISYYFLDDVSLSEAPLCNTITYDLILPPGNIYSSTLSGGFTPVTINNWNMYITGNFYVDHDLTFSDCNIILNTNSQIILTNNAKLTLTNKTHLFGCCTMWDGIYVRQGCELYSTKNVIVEDANHAFVSQTIGSAYGGKIYTDSTLFNRCYTGIEIQPNTASISPLYVINSVFTCRNILFDSINSNNLSVAQYSANLLSYTAVRQKGHPYRSVNGVLSTDVNNLQVGQFNTALEGPNKFDNHFIGVNWIRTNGLINNNIFQKLLSPLPTVCLGCDNPPGDKGIGIKAVGNSSNNGISVGYLPVSQNNSFYDVHTSVSIESYSTVMVAKSSINNTTTGPFGINQTGYGNRGIYVKPAATNHLVNIVYNTVRNCETGIHLVRNASNFSTLDIKIDTNTVDAVLPGYCTTGINVLDFLNNTSSPPTSEVNSNTIVNARYGITCTNTKSTSVKYNSITNLNASTGVRYGMKFGGCKEMKIENNHTKYSDGLAALSGGNLTAYGIYLSGSYPMFVKCNLMEDAGRSLVFEGNCNSPTGSGYGIIQNTMRRAQDGFVLLNSSAYIGTQGTTNAPVNNYWDLTTSPNFLTSHTASASLTTNTNSVMHVNNVPGPGTMATKPTANILLPGGQAYSTGIVTTGGSVSPCGYVPLFAPIGGNSLSTSSNTSSLTNDLNTLINNPVVYESYDDEIHWIQKENAYKVLNENASLMNSNSGLSAFYSSNNNTAIGKLTKVDAKIANGQYAQANTINNSINPSNAVVLNQKNFNMILLKKLTDPAYIYSSSDSVQLYEIAIKCPVYEGNAVYQARNLLMSITNEIMDFEGDCPEAGRSMGMAVEESAIELEKHFSVYPNPNNGSFTVDYSIEENDQADLCIYSIEGRKIACYKLNSAEKKIKIQENLFSNGMYFYQIHLNGKVEMQDKLIIIK